MTLFRYTQGIPNTRTYTFVAHHDSGVWFVKATPRCRATWVFYGPSAKTRDQAIQKWSRLMDKIAGKKRGNKK